MLYLDDGMTYEHLDCSSTKVLYSYGAGVLSMQKQSDCHYDHKRVQEVAIYGISDSLVAVTKVLTGENIPFTFDAVTKSVKLVGVDLPTDVSEGSIDLLQMQFQEVFIN